MLPKTSEQLYNHPSIRTHSRSISSNRVQSPSWLQIRIQYPQLAHQRWNITRTTTLLLYIPHTSHLSLLPTLPTLLSLLLSRKHRLVLPQSLHIVRIRLARCHRLARLCRLLRSQRHLLRTYSLLRLLLPLKQSLRSLRHRLDDLRWNVVIAAVLLRNLVKSLSRRLHVRLSLCHHLSLVHVAATLLGMCVAHLRRLLHAGMWTASLTLTLRHHSLLVKQLVLVLLAHHHCLPLLHHLVL